VDIIYRYFDKAQIMKKKFVIIGGGIAGLCAAIRLSELGEEPLVIEGGSYPSHKVCGEFLSPECIRYLEAWNINPVPIPQVTLRTPKSCLVLPFPSSAGGMSHIALDPALVNYASAKGAEIITSTKVTAFQAKKSSTDIHLIRLSNNETIEAFNVIIATGRFPHHLNKKPEMLYMGFKTHFENIAMKIPQLEMFSFPGAYLGISPIENNKFNVACLAEMKQVKDSNSQIFIHHLISQNPYLHSLLSDGKNLFDQWMVASVPGFGFKQTPDWLDAYFIGDAAMTIPPACGNGLSLAIFGGRLAAEYAKQKQAYDFKKMWIKRCSSQLFWAKILHKLMLNPFYSDSIMNLCKHFPSIATKVFNLTRQQT
jgi:menaquinone-9 beta-reductase